MTLVRLFIAPDLRAVASAAGGRESRASDNRRDEPSDPAPPLAPPLTEAGTSGALTTPAFDLRRKTIIFRGVS
jgi:hypothetical protein